MKAMSFLTASKLKIEISQMQNNKGIFSILDASKFKFQ